MAEESFTDAEMAFWRHVRFGELPPRVRPEDRVEMTETDPAHGWPEPAISQEQQRVLNPGAQMS